MNRFILCAAWVLSSLAIDAQKVYFIYIQSDAGQPFYVKMEDKVRSSTASGYLILSKLRDSTYRFSVGFPGKQWPERKFAVTVDKKDQGFMLKNMAEKGWALFNLQSLALLMPVDDIPKQDTASGKGNTDAGEFANILSKAADDPSLKEKPIQPKTEPVRPPEPTQADPVKESKPVEEKKAEPVVTEVSKTEPVAELKKPEPVPVTPTEPVNSAVKETDQKVQPERSVQPATEQEKKQEPVEMKPQLPAKEPVVQTPAVTEEKTETYKPSVVTRRAESSTTDGFGLTFTDSYGEGVADTIRILIPNPKPVAPVPVKEEPREEKKFLEQVSNEPAPGKNETAPVTEKVAARENSCPAIADEADFLKLRKRMAAETTDDNMIAEAKKIFKTKCFSTLQVRNLGALFLNDAGKYGFFDAAYPYVSDSGNFPALESELKDSYYINRFKAMLR